MKLFGNKNSKQSVCLIATNSVKEAGLEASPLHAASPDTAEAWQLLANQQCKDERTGEYIQFLSSTHNTPVIIYRGISDKIEKNQLAGGLTGAERTALIASQIQDQELSYLGQKGRNGGGGLLWLGICLALLTLTISVIALVTIL